MINLADLEQQAKKILPLETYDYIAGGAGKEWGIKNTLEAFSRYQIVPRVLTNVANIDIKVPYFRNVTTKWPIFFTKEIFVTSNN